MKRFANLFILAFAATLLLGLPSFAAFDNTGEDTANPGDGGDPEGVVSRDCSILYYGPFFGGDLDRLTGLGYTVTSTSNSNDLALANLQNYSVLICWLVGPGTITAYQSDIEQFVGAGGALYIHQPNNIGVVDYAPAGFEVDISSNVWDNCGTDPCLVDAGHPITMGLASADLSGNYDEIGSIGPGYDQILAQSCTCGTPSLAVGPFGAGVVVVDVGNLAVASIHPPSDQFVIQLADFLCTHGPVSTTDETWSGVKALYR